MFAPQRPRFSETVALMDSSGDQGHRTISDCLLQRNTITATTRPEERIAAKRVRRGEGKKKKQSKKKSHKKVKLWAVSGKVFWFHSEA